MDTESVRYIGGYGRMSWISKAEWQTAEPDPLGPLAASIIAHMNADHTDAMVLYCKAFSKATEITVASMTGIDRYGLEMSAKTKDGPRPVRVAFTHRRSYRCVFLEIIASKFSGAFATKTSSIPAERTTNALSASLRSGLPPHPCGWR